MSYIPESCNSIEELPEFINRELERISNALLNPIVLELYNTDETALSTSGVPIEWNVIRNSVQGYGLYTNTEIIINVDGNYKHTIEATPIMASGTRYHAEWHVEEWDGSTWTAIPGSVGGSYTRTININGTTASITFTREAKAGYRYRLIGTSDSGVVIRTVTEGCRYLIEVIR